VEFFSLSEGGAGCPAEGRCFAVTQSKRCWHALRTAWNEKVRPGWADFALYIGR